MHTYVYLYTRIYRYTHNACTDPLDWKLKQLLMFLSLACNFLVQFFSHWDHRSISLLRCIFRVLCLLYESGCKSFTVPAFKRWCLFLLPLNLGWLRWLAWPIECSRNDIIRLLKIEHKRSPPSNPAILVYSRWGPWAAFDEVWQSWDCYTGDTSGQWSPLC